MVNLYPFYDKVTSAGGIRFEDGIENIDIGGPAMIRAAAKVIYLTDKLNFLKFWNEEKYFYDLRIFFFLGVCAWPPSCYGLCLISMIGSFPEWNFCL